jgi:hypothetical protein
MIFLKFGKEVIVDTINVFFKHILCRFLLKILKTIAAYLNNKYRKHIRFTIRQTF